MPSLFHNDKFVAQIDEFEHQMVVVQTPTGEFVDAYGVNCGPYMMLFQENELDQLVAFAKALHAGMSESKQSEAATQARTLAAIIAHDFQTKDLEHVKRAEHQLTAQPVFAPGGRTDN